MSNEYRHNHYVPEWYQKRFVPPGQRDQELFYLDLHPKPFIDPRGIAHERRNPRRLGFRYCFAEDDLYTSTFRGVESTEIEQRFFGALDRKGRAAVTYYANFAHPWDGRDALQDILMYMSTQKLRTPKGLGWLSDQARATEKDQALALMLRLQQIYCAIWTECVWLIADAAQSDTKFIISDHPVTVYNRKCGPRSQWCRGTNDPDIRYHGTHTIFPLSLDKILILTNLSWVRNPYQSETELRPNPNFFRGTLFKITNIQTLRHLSEQEVREINFIIKTRAHRYIGAGKEEWLYPEEHVTKSNWYRYGKGYLLMPDPRSVMYSTEIIIGHKDGTATGYDEYGRRPWQKGYSGHGAVRDDWNTFHRFQGEFATLFGPYRRGRAFNVMRLDEERDSDEFHKHHLDLYEQHKNRWKKSRQVSKSGSEE